MRHCAAVTAPVAAVVLGCAGVLRVAVASADDGTMTYAQMEKILKDQGVTLIQTTSIGDGLPKSQCIVLKQLTSTNGHVTLSLDCTKPAKGSGSQTAGSP